MYDLDELIASKVLMQQAMTIASSLAEAHVRADKFKEKILSRQEARTPCPQRP
jgi:hypothetical protein